MIGGSMGALRNDAQYGSIGKAGIDPNANSSEKMISYWQRFVKNFSANTSTTTGKKKRTLSSVENQNNARRPKDARQ